MPVSECVCACACVMCIWCTRFYFWCWTCRYRLPQSLIFDPRLFRAHAGLPNIGQHAMPPSTVFVAPLGCHSFMTIVWARFLTLSWNCLRQQKIQGRHCPNYAILDITETAHSVTWNCLSTFWYNWTRVTKVSQVTSRKSRNMKLIVLYQTDRRELIFEYEIY